MTSDAQHNTPPRVSEISALVTFCMAAVLLIPMERYAAGGVAWVTSVACIAISRRREMWQYLGVLLLAILALAAAPIHTEFSTPHFRSLGLFFLAVVLGPIILLKVFGAEIPSWRFFPKRFERRDLIYTLISIPLAWGILELYFFHLNPDLAANWPLAHPRDDTNINQLLFGINFVGVWDELFFVNTVYAILRKLFPARIANLAQSVVYVSVLTDMAFEGWGPVIIYGFALTQGVMFEKSGSLVWVLLVHLIVDAFLVMAILQYHYPGQAVGLF